MKRIRIALTGISIAALGAASIGLASCAETDVVAQVAATSFKAVVETLGDQVGFNAEDQAWEISSPAGDKFLMALDFSRPNTDGESPDFELDFDAAPFLAAGLDPSKLPMGDALGYRLEDGRFMLHFEFGAEALKPAVDGSAPASAEMAPALGIQASFKQFLASYRERVGYHEKLDHYGIGLGEGNMIEWAKDLATNDKDLVFVLNPEPLIAAGLDPAKVEGWVFAKVEIKDQNGRYQPVDKLLKPFSL